MLFLMILWGLLVILLVLTGFGLIHNIRNPKYIFQFFLCLIIYVLTITRIFKWKKRLVTELFFQDGDHQYARKNMKLCKYGMVFPLSTSIKIGKKSYYSKINLQLFKFLEGEKLKPIYITNNTFKHTLDIGVIRRLKIKILLKELKVIE